MSEAETPIRRSDLPVRAAAGVVMIAIALFATWLGGWVFRVLVAAAAGLMVREWAAMHRIGNRWSVAAAVLIGVLLLVAPIGVALAGIGAGAAVLAVASRRGVLGIGMVYVGLPALAMILLAGRRPEIVLWMLVVTWATDILAYFAGRAIGGPKLAPRISPNKTWAGLAGGVAGAAVLGWAAARFLEIDPAFAWLGAPMGVIAQAGDLFESAAKRRAGVKDSGQLLPGHGGVLDRLDGLLAVAAATALALLAGLVTA